MRIINIEDIPEIDRYRHVVHVVANKLRRNIPKNSSRTFSDILSSPEFTENTNSLMYEIACIDCYSKYINEVNRVYDLDLNTREYLSHARIFLRIIQQRDIKNILPFSDVISATLSDLAIRTLTEDIMIYHT